MPHINPNASLVSPWTTGDIEELEGAVSSLAVQADFTNRRWAQKWFENFQFVLGNQNLRWSRQYDFAIDTDFLNQSHSNEKKSQTNISRTVVESLSAMIYSQLPELHFKASYDGTSKGARLARTLENIKESYDERLNLHEEFDSASVMFVMYSKVYTKVSWNKVSGGTFKRPKQQEIQTPKMTTRAERDPVTQEQVTVPVPTLDAEGNPEMVVSYDNVIGEDGQIVMETVDTGDVEVEMCSPFEIRYDPMAKTFAKAKWIQQVRVLDYDDFMVEFSGEEGTIEANIENIQGGVISAPVKHMAIRHFLRIMFATPPTLDFSGQMNLSSLMLLKNKVLVIEHYDRPSKGHFKNPTPYLARGRRTVLANGKLVLMSTPQYRTNKNTGWHPYSEAKWLTLSPSNEATGPMADTIAKNRELNLTDSLISLALQRQAGSTLLVNENSGLNKNELTGEPGLVQYVTGDPSGAAAYLADKSPMPNLVHQYREQVKEDIYEISGAQDATRGDRSTGATSGYQARLYEEREKKRTSKAMRNWEGMVGDTYEKIFCCLQQNAVKFDESVVSRIARSSSGDVSQSDIVSFLNGPVDYGVDITINAGSMSTKSKASQMASIAEALQVPGMAERIAADPSMLDKYLDFMEIDVLRDMSSHHRDRASKENGVFSDIKDVRSAQGFEAFKADLPEVAWQDDDMTHLQEHIKEYVSNYDKFKHNAIIMKLWAQHFTQHEQNFKAKQDEQSVYVASRADDMVDRAQQVGAAPKNLMQELTMFQERKKMEAEAMRNIQTAQRQEVNEGNEATSKQGAAV